MEESRLDSSFHVSSKTPTRRSFFFSSSRLALSLTPAFNYYPISYRFNEVVPFASVRGRRWRGRLHQAIRNYVGATRRGVIFRAQDPSNDFSTRPGLQYTVGLQNAESPFKLAIVLPRNLVRDASFLPLSPLFSPSSSSFSSSFITFQSQLWIEGF